MKKSNVDKTIICFLMSELFEILTLCIQVVQSDRNFLLTGAIILVIGLFLSTMKKNKNNKASGMNMFAGFMLYVSLSQLIYEIFPYNMLGMILAIPAVFMAGISIIIYLKKRM